MNLNIKTVFLAILLPLCFANRASVYGQGSKSYQISAEIDGLKEGVEIILKSLEGKETKTLAKDGKFSFSGIAEQEGMPYTLSISGIEKEKELLLDNELVLMFKGKLENWPNVEVEAPHFAGSYLDFQQLVQKPFSAAYLKYQDVMKALTGKSNVMDWETAIKQSSGIDSLRMALPKEIYNTATQTYIKAVFLWIGRFPGSYYSPQLIGMWWPEGDRMNAYNRLSQKVKDSYYGRILYDQLKTHR